jgi:hypothetical protein
LGFGAAVHLLTWIAFFHIGYEPFRLSRFGCILNLMSGILAVIPSVLVSTALTVVILGFGVSRLQSIQKLFQKEKIVPWDLIEKAEFKKVGRASVKFFLKPDNKLSIKGNTVGFSITKGDENNVERFLSAILSQAHCR